MFLGAHDDEFVAAQTRQEVLAGRAIETRRDLDEHLVADIVAIGVVDVLETVEVDQQQSLLRR